MVVSLLFDRLSLNVKVSSFGNSLNPLLSSLSLEILLKRILIEKNSEQDKLKNILWLFKFSSEETCTSCFNHKKCCNKQYDII